MGGVLWVGGVSCRGARRSTSCTIARASQATGASTDLAQTGRPMTISRPRRPRRLRAAPAPCLALPLQCCSPKSNLIMTLTLKDATTPGILPRADVNLNEAANINPAHYPYSNLDPDLEFHALSFHA